MKGFVGVVALLVIAWVLAVHDQPRHASNLSGLAHPSRLGELGESGALQSLVVQSSPAVFQAWEAELQQRMPIAAP